MERDRSARLPPSPLSLSAARLELCRARRRALAQTALRHLWCADASTCVHARNASLQSSHGHPGWPFHSVVARAGGLRPGAADVQPDGTRVYSALLVCFTAAARPRPTTRLLGGLCPHDNCCTVHPLLCAALPPGTGPIRSPADRVVATIRYPATLDSCPPACWTRLSPLDRRRTIRPRRDRGLYRGRSEPDTGRGARRTGFSPPAVALFHNGSHDQRLADCAHRGHHCRLSLSPCPCVHLYQGPCASLEGTPVADAVKWIAG